MIECKICKIEKSIEFFGINQKMKTGRRNECKECINRLSKERYLKKSTKESRKNKYLKNRESNIEYSKKWHAKNKIKRNEWRRDYSKKRRKDPILNLRDKISNLIRMSFRKNNLNKNSKTIDILECSFGDFKLYLESKFEHWMNWSNYGIPEGSEKKWTIDHIKPISSGKTVEKIIELNHYTNLQPLEFYENIKKSNNI